MNTTDIINSYYAAEFALVEFVFSPAGAVAIVLIVAAFVWAMHHNPRSGR